MSHLFTGYKRRGGAFGAVLLAVAATQRAAPRPRQSLLNSRVPGVGPRLLHAGAARPLPVRGPREEGRDGRRCGSGGRGSAAWRRQRLQRAAVVLVIVVENCCRGLPPRPELGVAGKDEHSAVLRQKDVTDWNWLSLCVVSGPLHAHSAIRRRRGW
jgi:hypothetical protein